MIESIFVLNGDRKSEPKNGQPSLAANQVYLGETVSERGVPPDRLTSVLPERVRVNYVTQEQENDDPNGGSFQRKRPRLDLQQHNQTFETQVTLQKLFSIIVRLIHPPSKIIYGKFLDTGGGDLL